MVGDGLLGTAIFRDALPDREGQEGTAVKRALGQAPPVAARASVHTRLAEATSLVNKASVDLVRTVTLRTSARRLASRSRAVQPGLSDSDGLVGRAIVQEAHQDKRPGGVAARVLFLARVMARIALHGVAARGASVLARLAKATGLVALACVDLVRTLTLRTRVRRIARRSIEDVARRNGATWRCCHSACEDRHEGDRKLDA